MFLPHGLDLLTERSVKIRHRSVVDGGEFESGTKVGENPSRLVFGDGRRRFVAKEARDRFLAKPDSLAGYPEIIEMVVSRPSHAAPSE
jgi:hypothetical protein